jgi:hypothetical protein
MSSFSNSEEEPGRLKLITTINRKLMEWCSVLDTWTVGEKLSYQKSRI